MKNYKNFIILSLITILFSSSCWSQKLNKEQGQKNVDYQIAERYFIKNTVPNGNFIYKLTSQDEFDNYFGAATVMGKNGKPTDIDFSKSFVVAIISESSTNEISLKTNSLSINKREKLVLNYTKETNEINSSMTMRVPLLLIVSKKHDHELLVQTNGTTVSHKKAKNYFIKNTVDNQLLYLPNISSEEQFNTYFGQATLMGEGGQPTVIDFEKEYAVAVIYPSTNEIPNLIVESVTNNNGVITIFYSAHQVEEGEKFREGTILILDKKDSGKIEFIELKR